MYCTLVLACVHISPYSPFCSLPLLSLALHPSLPWRPPYTKICDRDHSSKTNKAKSPTSGAVCSSRFLFLAVPHSVAAACKRQVWRAPCVLRTDSCGRDRSLHRQKQCGPSPTHFLAFPASRLAVVCASPKEGTWGSPAGERPATPDPFAPAGRGAGAGVRAAPVPSIGAAPPAKENPAPNPAALAASRDSVFALLAVATSIAAPAWRAAPLRSAAEASAALAIVACTRRSVPMRCSSSNFPVFRRRLTTRVAFSRSFSISFARSMALSAKLAFLSVACLAECFWCAGAPMLHVNSRPHRSCTTPRGLNPSPPTVRFRAYIRSNMNHQSVHLMHVADLHPVR